MMFWFFLAVIFLILWLRARQAPHDDRYTQGYSDGYHALRQELQKLVDDGRLNRSKALDTLIETKSQMPPGEGEEYIAQEVGGAAKEAEVDTTPTVHQAEARDPAKEAAEKARIILRNLNIVLYAASFLLVAAAASFVAAAMPSVVKIAGLVIATLLFYGAGLVLYERSRRLRPAAIAFVGTGLAIVPFVGVVLTTIGGVAAPVAWWVVSGVGLMLYVIAALRMNNQVLSYISLAFVLSLASSSVATASLPIVWHFVVLIIVSLIATSIGIVRPAWVPKVFRRPIETTGQIVTPIALVASLLAFSRLSLLSYEIVFAVATLHYGVAWLQSRVYRYEVSVRLLAHSTVWLIAVDLFQYSDPSLLGWIWLGLLVVQAIYSIRRMTTASPVRLEQIWLLLIFVMIVGGCLLWQWFDGMLAVITAGLVIVNGLSFFAWRAARAGKWLYAGLVANLWLPFVIGKWTDDTDVYWWIVAGTCGGLALAAAGLLRHTAARSDVSVKRYLIIATGVYVMQLLGSGALSGDAAVFGWALALAGGVGIVLSYTLGLGILELAGVLLGLLAVPVWLAEPVAGHWLLTMTVALSLAVIAVFVSIHMTLRQYERAVYVLVLAVPASAALLFAGVDADVVRVNAVLLTAVCLIILGLRHWWQRYTDGRHVTQAAYVTAALSAACVSAWTDQSWQLILYTVLAVVAVAASHIERRWWGIVFGAGPLLAAGMALAAILNIPSQWVLMTALVASGVVLCGGALWYDKRGDTIRMWAALVSGWVALLAATVTSPIDDTVRWLNCGIFIAVAIMVWWRYWTARSRPVVGWLLAGAAGGFIITAIVGWGVQYDQVVLGVGLWLAGTMFVGHSYHTRHVAVEAMGFAAGILAVYLWLGDAALPLYWQVAGTVGIGVGLVAIGIGVHQNRREHERRNLLVALGMLVTSGLVVSGLSSDIAAQQVSLMTLVLAATGSLVTRIGWRAAPADMKLLLSAGYAIYLILSWLIAMKLGGGWLVAAYLFAAIVVWTASHIERSPLLLGLGNVLIALAAYYTWGWLQFGDYWMAFSVAWGVAGVTYAQSWVYGYRKDVIRQQVALVSAWIPLFGVSLLFLFADTARELAAAVTLIVAAATVAVHGIIQRRRWVVEVAVYLATAGLQRVISIYYPDIALIWHVHGWVVVLIVMAKLRSDRRWRLMIAAGLMTAVTGIEAIVQGGMYQLLFLIEQAVLLACGALLRLQWALWWGVAGVAVSVMYFLKDFVYVWLGLLGLSLIGLVVWRLRKINK